MADVTRFLSQIEYGDPSAATQLLPLVYEELRKVGSPSLLAARSREPAGNRIFLRRLIEFCEQPVRLVVAFVEAIGPTLGFGTCRLSPVVCQGGITGLQFV